MQAQDIVSHLQGNPPIQECKRCMEHWQRLADFYSLWYKLPDPGSQVFLESELEIYLKHKANHTEERDAIYNVAYQYGQLLHKAMPDLDTVTLGLEAAILIQPLVEGYILKTEQHQAVIDGVIDGYHSKNEKGTSQ